MAKEQLHKRRTSEQVQEIINKYQQGEITGKQASAYIGIGRTRFYQLVSVARKDGDDFTIEYGRSSANNRINPKVEKQIKQELVAEKKLIDNRDIPIQRYNYSYIQDELQRKYQQSVSVNTIINRAKQWGYYQGKCPKKTHDREVITNYTGELIQHDSSHHLFAPLMGKKIYLTTSLDDFSRALLYADFWEQETSWNHIQAAQHLILDYGLPLKYYTDQHRIFRYVKNRDSAWYAYQKFTDDIDPQWRQVLKELKIEPIPALSPQAKGKIERPYGWIQDRVVRTCMREQVKTITAARHILKDLVYQYNWKWRHSTTGEIPMERYQDAIRSKQSLWRKFEVPKPFKDVRDVFCLRTTRIVNAYRNVSISNTQLKVPTVPPRQEVELRLSLDENKQLVEVRFWFKGYCVGRQTVKMNDLRGVRF